MAKRAVLESDLHAYVDGQLDPARRVEVEAYLAEDREAAVRVEAYREQAELLHALFDPVLSEPPPPEVEELRDRLALRLTAGNDNVRGRWYAAPWLRAVAAVALLVIGGTGGYLGHDLIRPAPTAPAGQPFLQTFAEEAAQAHAFYTTDSKLRVEMGAEDRNALDSWLSERLGRAVFGPDLSANGYRLIGGRSLPTATGAGAQYMYENEQNRRLTLFVGAPQSGQEAAFSFVQHGDIAMFYWLEGSLAYALIGRLSRDELMEITKTVYVEVKRGHRPAPPAGDPPATVQPQDAPSPVQTITDIKAKDS